jgi:glycosyltransferase involved in cell wall biosynthesis
LSVVIPCFNGGRTLAAQLEALSGQEWDQPWEVILADNGSTDDSVAITRRYQEKMPHLRIVDASDRPGQPHALNVGAEAARGESIAFCDADDEVAPGWVAAMGNALATNDFVAARIDTEKLNPPLTRRRSAQERGIQPYTYPPFLPHAGGGTLGVKRWLYEQMGGFDESLPYLHDTDLCWRVQRGGIALRFVPEAVVHVRQQHTLRGSFRQALKWGEYSVLLYKRYRPLGMPKLSPRQGLSYWRQLVSMAPRIRSRRQLARWVRELGWRIGRVRGSIKHRVLSI